MCELFKYIDNEKIAMKFVYLGMGTNFHSLHLHSVNKHLMKIIF
jgi:hypothetical protein